MSTASSSNGSAPAHPSGAITTIDPIPPSPLLASSTFLPRTPHFITGHYTSPHTLLPDPAYALCLDSLTKGCVDLLLTHRSTFLLAQRTQYPQRSWWYAAGGRTRPGESLQSAASRLLTRELGLPLPPHSLTPRLATLGHYSYAWEMRAQPPLHHGTADIAVLTSLELTDAERAAVDRGQGEEGGERRWLTAAQVVGGDFHPAVKRGVRDWQVWRAYRELDEAVTAGAEAAVVAQRGAEYVQAMRRAREGEDVPIQAAEHYLPEHAADAAKRSHLTRLPH